MNDLVIMSTISGAHEMLSLPKPTHPLISIVNQNVLKAILHITMVNPDTTIKSF